MDAEFVGRVRRCVDAGGRAVEHNAIRDDLGLMRQLGVGPGAS